MSWSCRVGFWGRLSSRFADGGLLSLSSHVRERKRASSLGSGPPLAISFKLNYFHQVLISKPGTLDADASMYGSGRNMTQSIANVLSPEALAGRRNVTVFPCFW